MATSDFGIQETSSSSDNLLDEFLDGTVTAKPEDVTPSGEPVKKALIEKKAEGKEEGQKADPEKIEPGQLDILDFLEDEEKDGKKAGEEGKAPDGKKDETQVPAEGAKEGGEGATTEEEENIYSNFAEELFKIGILTTDNPEEEPSIETPEDLKERLEVEKKKGAMEEIDSFLSNYGEDYRRMFDAVFVKGVSPKDYLQTYSTIESYSTLDLTQESNQEKVVREVLSSQGFEGEDLDKEVEKIKNYGDLEDTSKRYHKALVKREEARLSQLAQQKEAESAHQQRLDQSYHTSLQKILSDKVKEKEFDGYPVTPKIAETAFDFLYSKKWKLPTGELITDFDKFMLDLKRPENFPLKVKIGLLAVNNFDLTKVEKKGVSKEGNELFSALASKKKKIESSVKNSSAPVKQGIKSWFQTV